MGSSERPGSAPDPVPDRPRLAIVLAGGSGRRLGLVDKPALLVRGRTLLSLALDAVAPALTVVVGPPRELPSDVLQTREDPPQGGPAAALVAGLATLLAAGVTDDERDLVTVLAADLPGIGATAVEQLAVVVRGDRLSGALLVDPAGRDQYLAGVWRLGPLRAAAGARDSWHGGRVSDLLGPLVGVRIPVDRFTAADIDTTSDLLEWGAAPRASAPLD